METFNIGVFILKYPGVIVGFIFVIAAAAVLPARVRWYVLTAGLAVVIFRTYQLISADKRMAEADKERKRLQEELEHLGRERGKIITDLKDLNTEAIKIKDKQGELARESEALALNGDALKAEKERLEKQAAEASVQDKKMMDKIESLESALSLFDEAKQAFQEMEKASQ